ncbi:hypothetical protein GIB67_014676 [Kingdonia uniflora]|uniref:Tr-type G domain-containing protein n=1 Tax=Kingdonia uniflora TaxID=39325 RepID=A0A7J7LY83_9MAGN|nr:hypothetical protein GIB67_014676 [Kingdonia uniflora]
MKLQINIVFIGDTDTGKSTIFGHLVNKLVRIDKRTLNGFEKRMTRLGTERFKYVLLPHYSHIVNVVKNWKLETKNYLCLLHDFPCYPEFLPKMHAKMLQADCAVLVLDSTDGVFEDGISERGLTRDFASHAFLIGVRRIICCSNKMDAITPKYSKARYVAVVEGVSTLLREIGFCLEKIIFVPVCAYDGDNIVERSSNLVWYKGPTLVEALDMIDLKEAESRT